MVDYLTLEMKSKFCIFLLFPLKDEVNIKNEGKGNLVLFFFTPDP